MVDGRHMVASPRNLPFSQSNLVSNSSALFWYCVEQNTRVFRGDVVSIESAKSKLLSIANKQNVAPIVQSEQLFDELDLQARDSESSCEGSLKVSCDGVDHGERDLSATLIVVGKSHTECTSRSTNGLLTRSTCACPCVRSEIIAKIEDQIGSCDPEVAVSFVYKSSV